MTRLHTQDLRTICGAILAAPRGWGGTVQSRLSGDVDSLLALMERTAKSDPLPPMTREAFGLGPIPTEKLEVELGPDPQELAHPGDYSIHKSPDEAALVLAHGCHRAHPHKDDPDCPSNIAFYHGKNEGARETQWRLAPYFRHRDQCPGKHIMNGQQAMAACTCGLAFALEAKK